MLVVTITNIRVPRIKDETGSFADDVAGSTVPQQYIQQGAQCVVLYMYIHVWIALSAIYVRISLVQKIHTLSHKELSVRSC